MYTIKTVRGKLLPAWLKETRLALDEEIAAQPDLEEWVKNGMARRNGKSLEIDVVKVKLVEV